MRFSASLRALCVGLSGLALVVGLWIMLSGRRGVRIRPRDIVPDLHYGRRLVRIGVPASVEGTGLLGIVSTVVDAGTAFATIGGPLAPIILAGEVVVVGYVFAFVTERIVLVIADAVPGLAGILGT